MSDGDRAAPGYRGPDDSRAHDWITRNPGKSRGATPWDHDLFGHQHANERAADTGAKQSNGNHTDGISVADLIAKVGPVDGRQSKRHRRADQAPEIEEPAAVGPTWGYPQP